MEVEAQEVRAFVEAGQHCCRLAWSTCARDSWLDAMLHALLALYAASLALPAGQVEHEDAVTASYAVSAQELRALWERLGVLLAADRWYAAAGPLITSSKPPHDLAVGDLVDDLADIYRDLTPGLRYWESGTQEALNDVVWQWQFDFATHWGSHAVAALGLLHHLVIAGVRSAIQEDPPPA